MAILIYIISLSKATCGPGFKAIYDLGLPEEKTALTTESANRGPHAVRRGFM
jgi:hypothetical protein